jgi:hypothetical protein
MEKDFFFFLSKSSENDLEEGKIDTVERGRIISEPRPW